MDELTFRIQFEDGTFQDETVSLDFFDIDPLTMYAITSKYPEDEDQRNAALVRAKLSDPALVSQEMMVDLLHQLQRGEGVTVG